MAELCSKRVAEYLKAGIRLNPVEEMNTPAVKESGLMIISQAFKNRAETNKQEQEQKEDRK
ncbi:hypothetical protein [Niallia circulans]|uniref:hypothetical protein n=1 Tax=Niallia circulans TaxID=1397 RepID=UPI0026F25E5D|nr:hypothetical protein [Niallia circulans]